VGKAKGKAELQNSQLNDPILIEKTTPQVHTSRHTRRQQAENSKTGVTDLKILLLRHFKTRGRVFSNQGKIMQPINFLMIFIFSKEAEL
jgi:hypothetical protein